MAEVIALGPYIHIKCPKTMDNQMNLENKPNKRKIIKIGNSLQLIIEIPDLPESALTKGFDLSSLHFISLQELAMRRLAVKLCCHRKMLAYAGQTDSAARRQKEHETTMYDLLKNLLPEAPLPQTMKHELFSLMKSVSREIIKWLDLHEDYLGPCNLNEMENLKHLCWTSLGSVDYRKTAAALIRHEKLGVAQRYKLACLYCLEEDIRELWQKMPEKSKKSYYDAKSVNVRDPDLAIIWTFIIKGEVKKILRYLKENGRFHPSINHLGFECAAIFGYRTAAQYFYEKLTFEEKEELLIKTAMSVALQRSKDYYFYMEERQESGDVLFYLMSVMQSYEQKILFSHFPCEILKCVLDWPRQDAFIELAKSEYPSISGRAYYRVLLNLSRNSSWGYNHSKLFQQFFLLDPLDFNFALVAYNTILRDFIRSDDIETVKFLFRHLVAQGKDEHVLVSTGSFINFELMKEGKWELMNLFIEEVKLSESGRRRNLKLFSENRGLNHKERIQRLINESNSTVLYILEDVQNNTDLEIQEEEEREEPKAVKKLLIPLKAAYDKCIDFLFR
ncbi:uncharacterized protein LOC129957402 [Argiope bruennichi]|uniref:Uncharacterized protein n=1 Tax=Argiope bruennichi TaxID=94029 RepID=A0A8T0FK79_ARGBR|nr:uncharacterized protein LOC129957402 [Argiope bruennichi]KAF8789780.1 hypothetical protein HNY73_007693 [Argiope bruennichi]